MTQAVLTLDFEPEYNFDVIGLISDVREYKLAWLAGKVLGVELLKKEDIIFQHAGNKQLLISNFVAEEEYYSIRLLKNKAYESNGISKPYLLPEVKNYDYFIQVEGEYTFITIDEIKMALRNYAIIQYAEIIEIDTLKSKENLIY